jgi:hypothetical protein
MDSMPTRIGTEVAGFDDPPIVTVPVMTNARAEHPSFQRTSRRPMPAAVRPVNMARVCIWTVVIALVAWATMHAVDSMTVDSAWMRLAVFGIGFVVLPMVASPIEWFVHRFVYHEAKISALGAIHTVHTTHHVSYFPTWRYVTGGPARRLPVTRRTTEVAMRPTDNARIRLSHFLWYMAFGAVLVWTPAWLITGDPWFLAGLIAGSVTVSNLFIVVHDTIHRPGSHRVVESQPWFVFLDNHHWIHHVDMGVNLNFLLPLADLLFGTLRRHQTAPEIASHGTLASAKRRPVGAGERAHLMTTHTPGASGFR